MVRLVNPLRLAVNVRLSSVGRRLHERHVRRLGSAAMTSST